VCRVDLTSRAQTFSNELWVAFQNELRHVEDFDCSINSKCLIELLKCNNCKFIPTNRPIMQCINGHLICDECGDSYSTFPECRICDTYFFSLKYRSLIAETILSFLYKPCRFKHNGCEMMIADLNDHEKEQCIFREVKCVFVGCYKIVQIGRLKDHLEEEHENYHTLTTPFDSNLGDEENKTMGNLYFPENLYDIDSSDWNRVLYLKLYKTYNFVPVCWASKFFKKCIFWVHYLGLPCESEKFYFKLRLFSKGHKKEISVTGPVTSLNKDCFQMFNLKSAFKIPFSKIQEYWGQTSSSLFWEVSVFQKSNSEDLNENLSLANNLNC